MCLQALRTIFCPLLCWPNSFNTTEYLSRRELLFLPQKVIWSPSCHRDEFDGTATFKDFSLFHLELFTGYKFHELVQVARLDLHPLKKKKKIQTLILWTLCFNKATHASIFTSALTIFSNEVFFTLVGLEQLQNRHWSNIKKWSQHIQFNQQLLWDKASPFFSIEYINIYSNKWLGGERRSYFYVQETDKWQLILRSPTWNCGPQPMFP